MTGAQIKLLIRLTFADPKTAARQLITMNPPAQARWLGLALVAVLTILVMRLTVLLVPAEEMTPVGIALRNPVSGFAIQVGSILLVAAAMTGAGRVFGGRGQFQDALLLMVWTEFLLAIIAGVQLVLLMFVPLAGVVLTFLAVGLFAWLIVQFAAALHGFTNLWAVLAGMIATFFLLAVATALVLAILGIDPTVVSGPI